MRMRLGLGVVVVVLLTMVRGAVAGTPPKGEAEWRAGWQAFTAPSADPEKSRSVDARQEARMTAIAHMEAAVAADPTRAAYLESLTYVCLSAGQYDKAKAAIDKAVAVERNSPLLHLLRGQAEAALAQMNPPEAGNLVRSAMAAFDRAAELDRTDSLPLLQAASVAFDLERPDLALPRVKKALERTKCTLYRLTMPTDLDPDKRASVRSWQYVQLGHWMSLVARFRNVTRFCMKLGLDEESKGNLDAARERFREALEVGRQVGAADPNLFVTAAAAADMMEDAYGHVARVEAEALIRGAFAADCSGQEWPGFVPAGKALIEGEFARASADEAQRQEAYQKWSGLSPAPTGLDDSRWTSEPLALVYAGVRAQAERPLAERPEIERWLGERGVVSFARGQLAVALQAYVKELANSPPEVDVEQVLALEETLVAPVIAGIGLRPKKQSTIGGASGAPALPGGAGKPRSAMMTGPMPVRTG